jgi:tRNA(Ile)-lysidine synthase
VAELLKAIERKILSRHLLKRGERVLVAVSGGVDSMVLLRALHELSGSYGWRLRVAHLNHCLRGRSSDADERLVRRTCASLKLPLSAGRRSIRAFAARKKLSIEMAAREVRHAFLAQTALRNRITRIALAHHADDQVELFFLRLLRGSGSEGLGGMRWSRPSPANPAVTLVRPLLDQPKSALAQYARRMHLRHREDASNTLPDILRNRIRMELLPLLRKKYQPALSRTILRVVDILGAEAEFVSQAAEEWGSLASGRQFSEVAPAVQRRWLQRQLAAVSIPSDFDLIEALRLRPGCPITVADRRTVSCGTDGRVRVQSIERRRAGFRSGALAVDVSTPSGRAFFDGVQVSWSREPMTSFSRPRSRPGIEEFDADLVGSQIRLRHWRRGDRFQPIGMHCAVKLQDFFTNEKVLRKRRHETILAVTVQNEVFWVEGARISERFKLTEATKSRLVWRWERP